MQDAAAPQVTNVATASAPGSPDVSATDTAPVLVPPPPTPIEPDDLASTGVQVPGMLLTALNLLALGALLIVFGRRWRRSD